MHLSTWWFVVTAIFWVGFFVLEGFDFGVGMLHSFISRTDIERRIAINSIGPVWDGNEVWLIVASAVIFAAFPGWYGTMFSALYLVFALLLVALMVRGVSFEYGRKVDRALWRAIFRWTLTIGSLLVPFLIGLSLGDLLHGLPINSNHDYTGTFFQLLTPYGLYTGITLVGLSILMGATYLTLRTTDDLHRRVQRVAAVVSVISLVLIVGFVTWTHVALGTGFLPNPIEVFAVLVLIAAVWLATAKIEAWAFAAAALGMATTVGTVFVELYPRVMVSTTNSAYSLTVANTASPSYTLRVMTVVALILLPVVLAYQGWSYRIFRGRLRAPRVPGEASGSSVRATAGEPE